VLVNAPVVERRVGGPERRGWAGTPSDVLIQLGRALFAEAEWETLDRVAATAPLDRQGLVDFDDGLWGPSLSRIANNRRNAPGTLGIPGHGITRCELEDGDVFKPLHYCAVYLLGRDPDAEWMARPVVQMSGAHLEQLVKRIGPLGFLSFGNVLKQAIVKGKIDPATWDLLWHYRGVYNAAKHQFNHPVGTHLFSVRDAVLAYAVARRLGQELYSLADLRTDPRFERDPSPYLGQDTKRSG
jgi:hypothetical protein